MDEDLRDSVLKVLVAAALIPINCMIQTAIMTSVGVFVLRLMHVNI